jgi:primosomal protein N''
MYKTTRQTIYIKLKEEELQPYIIKSDKGLRLQQEGLSVLNVLMGDSKVKPQENTNRQKNNSKLDSSLTPQNDSYIDKYIQDLHGQIEALKREKQELQLKYDCLVESLINSQKAIESREQKEKRTIWQVLRLKK